ncbi:probable NOT transcription complex subunit VIP2 isoform X2 [Telopea speciosissima]|uniref:probable NOT transcription complex subunit VIP2 isoform X2 n=1 Tax=Telopea speciosissima TaxID=54955 RepID=UPI001CC3AAD9|nr:probable NOT transcription complex subunit VIP2 isoform X2 [Telopea speciosissima]
MSGLLNSGLNGSSSNIPDNAGRPFGSSFSVQSASTAPVFHHTGSVQGLHNIHGSFNIPNMPGTLASRNSAMNGVPSNGAQQPVGSLSSGRFASNNLHVALSQMSHASSHGHSGVTNRGGLGVSPILGNTGPRITTSMGNIVGASNMGRSLSSGGGLSMPGLASRLSLAGNSGSGSLSVQGPNRLMGGVLPQGSLRKQSVGVIQQNQEFSIQNEDFPALPGYKGGNTDYSMDLHQKEQLNDNAMSMMQSQHFPMGRSSGFSLGGTYSSHRQQQQQQAPSVGGSGVSFGAANNQDLLHMHGSDLFPSSHASYHSQVQNNGPPNIGLRPVNNPNSISGMGSYDQLIQQYQQLQSQSQFHMQQMSAVGQSYRDQNLKVMQAMSDRFGLLGLLGVIKMSNPNLNSLALGTDLTTLGLNLSSTNDIHKKFASPWSDEPAKGEHEYQVPECYYAKPPPQLHQGYFSKFQPETLFYIFYSMPKDEAQLYAANELYNRGWFYHRDLRLWLIRVSNMEPLVKTNTYERGSYLCFDPNTCETVRKDNFVLHYELLEKRPVLPQH